MCTLTTALVISPFLPFPKPKLFPLSRLNFHLQLKPLSRTRRYPSPIMVDCQSTVDDESVGVRVEGSEQEGLIHGFSTSTSAGLNATLNRLSKSLLAVFLCIIVLWRHDGEALWAAIGSFLNHGLSNVLKRILNQERPVSTLRSDPGMPSSHAQSTFYIVMVYIVSIVEYFGFNGITAAVSALIFASGSYLSWLRVSQQLHTNNQVAVGAAIGFSFSIYWFLLWDAIVQKSFVSLFWVQLIIFLGTAAICVSFLLYVLRYRVLEDN